MNILMQTIAYIVVILSIAISYQYENLAYTHLLSKIGAPETSWMWAVVVAAAFNMGKLVTFKSIIDAKSKHISYLWKSYIAVTLLVANSFICSFAVMSYSLDSPMVDQVVQERKQHHNEAYQLKEQSIIKKYDRERTNLVTQFEQERLAISAQYKPAIDKYDADLKEERQIRNLMTGSFKGKRYIDIEVKLNKEKKKQEQAFDALQIRQDKKITELNNNQNSELQTLSDSFSDAYNNLTASAVKNSGDARIQDPMFNSAVNVFNGVSGKKITYVAVIMAFSIMMSLIIEFLSFSTLQYINRLNETDEAIPPTTQETDQEENVVSLEAA